MTKAAVIPLPSCRVFFVVVFFCHITPTFMTLIEYSLCRLLIYSVFPLRAKPPASRFKNISQHEDDATPDTRSEKKWWKPWNDCAMKLNIIMDKKWQICWVHVLLSSRERTDAIIPIKVYILMSSNRLHFHLCQFFFLVTVKTKRGNSGIHNKILNFIFLKQLILGHGRFWPKINNKQH